MKYLVGYQLFEAVTIDFSKKPKLYVIYGEMSEYEEKIKELSFILNDIGNDTETYLVTIGGQSILGIKITSRIYLGKSSDQMLPRGNNWEKARKWIDELALSEDYLEYIDRVRSIISDEHDVYVVEHDGDKLKYWDFNCLEIRLLNSTHRDLPGLPNMRKTFSGYDRAVSRKMVPIEEAIEKFEEQNLGIHWKSKKMV